VLLRRNVEIEDEITENPSGHAMVMAVRNPDMWDLWWTKWNLVRFSSKHFRFLLSVIILPLLYILTNFMEQRPLQNLIATHIVKKIPAFYGTLSFIIVFTTARHWSL
jgi:hypothetical protein